MDQPTAVQADGLTIPLIDFSKFLTGTPTEKLSTARAILTGFQTAGFIYLHNHPIPASSVTAAFSASAQLFSLPLPQKLSYAWTTPASNRGYSAPGREKVSLLLSAADVALARASAPDIKESFEIGRDNEPGRPNHWPSEPSLAASFRSVMTSFIAECNALQREVMRAIAVGMGLDDGFFDAYISKGDNTMRLLHYPAVGREVFEENPGQVRAGEHSDYGSVTLLFQDGRGGLQVRAPGGGFVDAVPVEGAVVVNAGDLLARWSNETIRSTVHRVVEPRGGEEGGVYPARYSIAYFCNPDFDQFIEALPGTYETEADKKYPGINSGEYLVQRLEATY
ncbi:hypothetical protein QBC39DRAFT_73655 [Podospora conica]|nr:hypothetical protein QBC39DRAFT_73655 [Schizothecium conicum]